MFNLLFHKLKYIELIGNFLYTLSCDMHCLFEEKKEIILFIYLL